MKFFIESNGGKIHQIYHGSAKLAACLSDANMDPDLTVKFLYELQAKIPGGDLAVEFEGRISNPLVNKNSTSRHHLVLKNITQFWWEE